MLKNGFSIFKGKNILLLQGPIGPFFYKLSKELQDNGANVYKINFNGGDWLFYPKGCSLYTDLQENFSVYLEQFITKNHIDSVFLFGDCRPIHVIAKNVVSEQKIEMWVFEEGYIRPDFITFEKFGVNGYSKLPKNRDFYLNFNDPDLNVVSVGRTFWQMVGYAIIYYLASFFSKPFFMHYKHHRSLNILESFYWIRSLYRKFKYKILENGIETKLIQQLNKKYFLVPLQVYNDSQIREHSEFEDVDLFIRHVVDSFANNAPQETIIVFKHHPMDRGYKDYSKLLKFLRKKYNLKNRLFYIHDQHLPKLLDSARGVVLVNSTVGISALYHEAPLISLGNAIYNFEGLTYQGDLNNFWFDSEHFVVDKELFKKFREYIIVNTQLNGSYYKKLSNTKNKSGLKYIFDF